MTSLFFLYLSETFSWFCKWINSCYISPSHIWRSHSTVVTHPKLSFIAAFSVVLIDLQSIPCWSRQLACWVVVNHLGSQKIDFLRVFIELWFDLGLFHVLPCLLLPYNFNLLLSRRFFEDLVLSSHLNRLLKRFKASCTWLHNLRLVKSFTLLLNHKSHLLICQNSCCRLLCLLQQCLGLLFRSSLTNASLSLRR